MRLLTDENFNADIVSGLRLRKPDIELIQVQEVGLDGWDDPDVLEWAAAENRITLTNDVSTMIGFAEDRLRNKQQMSGLFVARKKFTVAELIDEFLIVVECSLEGEWESQIRFIPLN